MCLNYEAEYTTKTPDSAQQKLLNDGKTDRPAMNTNKKAVCLLNRTAICYVLSARFVTSHLPVRHSQYKGKARPVHAMKVHGRSRGITPLIPNLGTG